jgi:hypothetical protein
MKQSSIKRLKFMKANGEDDRWQLAMQKNQSGFQC